MKNILQEMCNMKNREDSVTVTGFTFCHAERSEAYLLLSCVRADEEHPARRGRDNLLISNIYLSHPLPVRWNFIPNTTEAYSQ